ncbi:uncharacterized protein TNCV_4608201 [Trichonephila clavipes]|nr:uncharacterized protein TNCV_4608201 [Trichonephila clavipes]
MNINRYTNAKLADIPFICSLANGNGHAAVWLYGERYPKRRQSNHQTFTSVHQNLAEYGFFKVAIEGTGRLRTARTPVFEKGVLHAVDRNPSTSVRALTVAIERSRTTLHHVL